MDDKLHLREVAADALGLASIAVMFLAALGLPHLF